MASVGNSRLRLFRLLAIALGFVLALGISELLATAYLWARDGHYIPARQRFAGNPNTFITQITTEDASCRYVDTLFPHPYLGFVHHGNPPCGITNINNIGLFGANFASEHRDDRFVILSTGGSVAAQMAGMKDDDPHYLEEILNRDYVSPNGKPFLVLNGADGAWKQPQQVIIFLLYADAVDAMVTLDGFNEHYMLDSSERMEYPSNNFVQANPLAERDFGGVIGLWIKGKIAVRLQQSAVFSRSNLAYLVARYLRDSSPIAANRRTTVESVFALPAEWTPEKRFQWTMKQYEKYILAMQSVAAEHKVLTSYFIQPAPAVGKALTEREKSVVGDLSYGPNYRRMADELLSLQKRQVPMHSLLEIFANTADTLYGDPVHLEQAGPAGSPGYRKMAEEMAARIAEDWKLKPKN